MFPMKMALLQVFCVQAHVKVFQSYEGGGKFGNVFQHIYIALIMMNLMYAIQMYKSMFCIKSNMNSIRFSYTGSHK